MFTWQCMIYKIKHNAQTKQSELNYIFGNFCCNYENRILVAFSEKFLKYAVMSTSFSKPKKFNFKI